MQHMINPIAYIKTDFPEKFGVPKQSGLVPSLTGHIQFTADYQQPEYITGIEEFSHLWLIWGFSKITEEPKQATVRPPRLGGNETRGVFATRSPFRPNRLGLSVVTINNIDYNTPNGPVITVGGIDMVDGTPIYDIKPYIPYADAHPAAKSGFVENYQCPKLKVSFVKELEAQMPTDKLATLRAILAQDPRPRYHNNPERLYGMRFEEFDVKFVVDGEALLVTKVVPKSEYY